MTCHPPLLQIVKSNYAKPRGYYTPFDELLAAAWTAVNLHMPPHRNNSIDGLYRYHIELWATGPKCLLSKSRLRQICLARGLVLHYLQTGQGIGCKRAGQMFGRLDHSTALHWKGNVNYLLYRQKFETPEKKAAEMFLSLVG